jgi:hypothetical protein
MRLISSLRGSRISFFSCFRHGNTWVTPEGWPSQSKSPSCRRRPRNPRQSRYSRTHGRSAGRPSHGILISSGRNFISCAIDRLARSCAAVLRRYHVKFLLVTSGRSSRKNRSGSPLGRDVSPLTIITVNVHYARCISRSRYR